MTVENPITLVSWRRQVAEIYAAVRRSPDPATAWELFRQERDNLLRQHPQTPLSDAQRGSFSALPFFPYDPDWRVSGQVDTAVERITFELELPAEGLFRFTRIGHIHFSVTGHNASLDLYWIEGYGGGLFLPFRDASNKAQTYGGGRYLLDTIKGADLGGRSEHLILDFNFAYNPSCAYNDRWVCPLALPANHLPFAVPAGERRFPSNG